MLNWRHRRLNPDPGEGGTPPADPPADPPAAKTETAPAPDDGGAGGKEAVLADLARERDKRQALETDVKSIKEQLVEEKKKSDAMKSALLKAAGVEDPDGDPVEVMKAKLEKSEAKMREALVRSAVIAEASKAGAVDPDDVAALLDRSALEIDLDNLKVTGVEEAVKELLEKKPHLKAATPGQPKGAEPPGGDPDAASADRDEMIAIIKRARQGDEAAQVTLSKNLARIRELGIAVSEV